MAHYALHAYILLFKLFKKHEPLFGEGEGINYGILNQCPDQCQNMRKQKGSCLNNHPDTIVLVGFGEGGEG